MQRSGIDKLMTGGRRGGPALEALRHDLAVASRGKAMPSWSEVVAHRAEGLQEPPGVLRRLEPLHCPLPLAQRPMRVLGSVEESAHESGTLDVAANCVSASWASNHPTVRLLAPVLLYPVRARGDHAFCAARARPTA